MYTTNLNIDGDYLTVVKAFAYSFPDYFLNKIGISDKEFKIQKNESDSIRNQFKRLINAFQQIYGFGKLKTATEISKTMVEYGIFNIKLAKLLAIKGIGISYADRLLKNGITSKTDLFDTYSKNKNKLANIMGITTKRLKMIMGYIYNEPKRINA